MEKKVIDKFMNKAPDIVFVKCGMEKKPGTPFVTVVASEPGKSMRIIPFTEKERFEKFLHDFVKTYNYPVDSFLSSLRRAIFINDMDTEYRIICNNQSVKFFAKYDALTNRPYITRTDIEDYPNDQKDI